MTDRIQVLLNVALQPTPAPHPDLADFCLKTEHLRGSDRIAAAKKSGIPFFTMPEGDLLAGRVPEFCFWERRSYGPEPPRPVFDAMIPLLDHLWIHGGNHLCVDYGGFVDHGIDGFLTRVEKAKQTWSQDPEKLEYLLDLEFACHSILAWAEAWAEGCEQAAQAADPERREELLKLAAMCRKVPKSGATSFHEAVQGYYMIHMLCHDGLGRIDQYLYPYYAADLEAGKITREMALELMEDLLINIFRVHGIEHELSGITHGVIGGYTPDRTSGHNACTSMILQATTELPLWRPQISYRWSPATTVEQLQEVMNANFKRPDVVMLLNDQVIISNLENLGIPFEDAVNYSVSGCNELVLSGNSHMSALEGHYNMFYSFHKAIHDDLESVNSFDGFYAILEKHMREDLQKIVDFSYERDWAATCNPNVLYSLFMDGCIESGKSLTAGGAKYNHCTWCVPGLVNLADSLSVIQQMVFWENRVTLSQLRDALDANWEGYEDLRRDILRRGRYFGNDDPLPDQMINRIGATLCRLTDDQVPFRGGKYLFGTLTGYEVAHVAFGKHVGATPDGRYDGDSFEASVAPFPGADRNGVTAYLKSAASIDGKVFPSSVVVNLTLDRVITETEEKRQRLTALIAAYLQLGGVQLQINYLSPNELIAAQKNPEKYRSLRVRVTGFSGFFVTLGKDVQDELIDRALMVC